MNIGKDGIAVSVVGANIQAQPPPVMPGILS
jgi:hypothetical protein